MNVISTIVDKKGFWTVKFWQTNQQKTLEKKFTRNFGHNGAGET